MTRMATEGAKATASGVEAQVVGAAAAGPENWLVVLWLGLWENPKRKG